MSYVAEYSESKLEALTMLVKFSIDQGVVEVDSQLTNQVINVAIRKLHDSASSFRGEKKYLGHPGWSNEALAILDAHDGAITRCTSKLRHEHIVPISVVVEKLLSYPKNTPLETFKKIILKYAAVVIISSDEDALFREYKLQKTMPANWDGKDVFARYKIVGLYDKIKFT
ncbi:MULTISPECIES: hypothetical protein [unclassified Shewanella]|uniref:hypothetical protein n=1 Tax=unclassified Shewanella TaxID=196818 RepID=UPI001BC7F40A|nr:MULTISPECIES: hypothetical protein [unclassified Shewanella]GIU15226.1 hypothetical protein TUM4444_26100 [Shewanella sp. MBTL60-112-B1]GIU34646.1 hypothetical protein TUM4445_23470 [Shewanella sp. MBTL60-112-B2]